MQVPPKRCWPPTISSVTLASNPNQFASFASYCIMQRFPGDACTSYCMYLTLYACTFDERSKRPANLGRKIKRLERSRFSPAPLLRREAGSLLTVLLYRVRVMVAPARQRKVTVPSLPNYVIREAGSLPGMHRSGIKESPLPANYDWVCIVLARQQKKCLRKLLE